MFFIIIYNLLFLLLYPLVVINFLFRIYKGKISRKRILEKFSISKNQKPNKKLIWIHCASVGEFNSTKPLLKLISQTKDNNILITSGTITSANEIQKFQQTFPNIIHQFSPIDGFFITRKFIKFWSLIELFLLNLRFGQIYFFMLKN